MTDVAFKGEYFDFDEHGGGGVLPSAPEVTQRSDSRNDAKPSSTAPTESVGPFLLGPVLGRGCTGTVRLGTHKVTGFQVAFKIIKKSLLNTKPRLWAKVKREIAILKLIDHPNILKLFDVLETSDRLYLALEPVKGGELFDYIIQKGRLDRDLSLRLVSQIVQGLEHCHAHSICHRDLKPENLLLDEKHNIKIADFGMAQLMKENNLLSTSCGSPHYASPEVINGTQYDGKRTDVWSIGVILYALITGSLPFDDDSLPVLLNKVAKGEYHTPSFVPEDISDLIARMLTVDPRKRIAMSDIKRHRAFVGTTHFPTQSQSQSPPLSPDTQYRKMVAELDDQVLGDLESLGWGTREELRQRILSNDASEQEQVFYKLMVDRKKRRIMELQTLSPKPRMARSFSLSNSSPSTGTHSLGPLPVAATSAGHARLHHSLITNSPANTSGSLTSDTSSSNSGSTRLSPLNLDPSGSVSTTASPVPGSQTPSVPSSQHITFQHQPSSRARAASDATWVGGREKAERERYRADIMLPPLVLSPQTSSGTGRSQARHLVVGTPGGREQQTGVQLSGRTASGPAATLIHGGSSASSNTDDGQPQSPTILSTIAGSNPSTPHRRGRGASASSSPVFRSIATGSVNATSLPPSAVSDQSSSTSVGILTSGGHTTHGGVVFHSEESSLPMEIKQQPQDQNMESPRGANDVSPSQTPASGSPPQTNSPTGLLSLGLDTSDNVISLGQSDLIFPVDLSASTPRTSGSSGGPGAGSSGYPSPPSQQQKTGRSIAPTKLEQLRAGDPQSVSGRPINLAVDIKEPERALSPPPTTPKDGSYKQPKWSMTPRFHRRKPVPEEEEEQPGSSSSQLVQESPKLSWFQSIFSRRPSLDVAGRAKSGGTVIFATKSISQVTNDLKECLTQLGILYKAKATIIDAEFWGRAQPVSPAKPASSRSFARTLFQEANAERKLSQTQPGTGSLVSPPTSPRSSLIAGTTTSQGQGQGQSQQQERSQSAGANVLSSLASAGAQISGLSGSNTSGSTVSNSSGSTSEGVSLLPPVSSLPPTSPAPASAVAAGLTLSSDLSSLVPGLGSEKISPRMLPIKFSVEVGQERGKEVRSVRFQHKSGDQTLYTRLVKDIGQMLQAK